MMQCFLFFFFREGFYIFVYYGGRLGTNYNYRSIALFLKQGDGAMHDRAMER